MMIPFLSRQWYRIVQGASVAGFPVQLSLLVLNTYGIWKSGFTFYNIQLVPFLIVGIVIVFAIYFGTGFFGERVGFFKNVQDHMNRENNTDWADAYSKIKKIAAKLEVE
jgi:hypothetical protein